ncbi:hypothetical protein HDU97_000381 [Phlyctochytrium planicorne]|nr:hypothetical protein HDU97_000381 [Phlyctochytrium planicorne]
MSLMFTMLAEASIIFSRKSDARHKKSDDHHHHGHGHVHGPNCSHSHSHEEEKNEEKVEENSNKLTYLEKIDVHASIAFASVAFAVMGVFVIYYNKELNNRPHFSSWHGTLGAIFLVFCLGQGAGGMGSKQSRS